MYASPTTTSVTLSWNNIIPAPSRDETYKIIAMLRLAGKLLLYFSYVKCFLFSPKSGIVTWRNTTVDLNQHLIHFGDLKSGETYMYTFIVSKNGKDMPMANIHYFTTVTSGQWMIIVIYCILVGLPAISHFNGIAQ